MTEAERARELADRAESEGYIDVGRVHDEVDMRIWIKGARLLAAANSVDPDTAPVDVSALRLQAAVDAMEFVIDDGDVDFLKAWLEDDVSRIRRLWPKFDLASLQASKWAARSVTAPTITTASG